MSVIVVGGGIAGVACARRLTASGIEVQLRDRGRRLGGRLGLRRYDERPVDIGAAYFTVSDPGFAAVVDDWRERGLARPWTDTLTARDADGRHPTSGPTRWSAPAGLRSLVDDLATGLDVRSTARVAEVGVADGRPTVDGEPADAVVLAMPDPQAARLLTPELADLGAALDVAFDPVLVLTTLWPERRWADLDAMFVNDSEVLDTIADDGRRRGDHAPVLVAHSTSAFARPRLDDAAAAEPELLAAVRTALDLPATLQPSVTSVHRWSFAKPARQHDAPYRLTDTLVGVCGDAWGPSSKVETAFASGDALGAALVARLSAS